MSNSFLNTTRLSNKWASLALLTAGLSGASHAQSTFAFQGMYAGNGSAFTAVASNGGATTAQNPFTASQNYTGLDSHGNAQTMNVTGSSWSNAEYGKMHVFGQGTVTNPYYNSANPSYFDGTLNPNGSPESVSMNGNAGWSDVFTYTGTQLSGYKVNYYFQLEGMTSGDIEAGLNFTTSDPAGQSYNPRIHSGGALWITPWYQVTWNQPFTVNADFYAGLNSHVSTHTEGLSYSGSASYGNTLTLAGMTIEDPNGNLFTNWSMTSASGTVYPTGAVPEPLPIFGIGLGLGGLLIRRRRALRS